MEKVYIKCIAGEISPAKRWHTHDFPHSSEAEWQRRRSKTGQRSAANPLVNSSFQRLEPCRCGIGTPALAVLDGYIYFVCTSGKGEARQACGLMTTGVQARKGARWEAAALWNELVTRPFELPSDGESVPQTIILSEEEWLAQQHQEYEWARRTGVHKVIRRR